MSIEQDAQKDLVLGEDDAAGIVGGKKAKKTTAKAKTYPVKVIVEPGFPGVDQPAQFVVGNMGNDDCSDGTETAT
jgi:hypothetical protein